MPSVLEASLCKEHILLCEQKLEMRCAVKSDAAAVCVKLKAVSKFGAMYLPKHFMQAYIR